MSYRTRTIRKDFNSEPIFKLKELGYLVNLTILESKIGIRAQSFRVAFNYDRFTHMHINKEKIEQYLKDNLSYNPETCAISFLRSLGKILNITELSRNLDIEATKLKSCIDSNKCKTLLEFQEKITTFVKEKFSFNF